MCTSENFSKNDGPYQSPVCWILFLTKSVSWEHGDIFCKTHYVNTKLIKKVDKNNFSYMGKWKKSIYDGNRNG